MKIREMALSSDLLSEGTIGGVRGRVLFLTSGKGRVRVSRFSVLQGLSFTL